MNESFRNTADSDRCLSDQGGSSEGGEECSDSAYTLKVEPLGFAHWCWWMTCREKDQEWGQGHRLRWGRYGGSRREGPPEFASGPSGRDTHQTSKRGCPLGSWVYGCGIWWKYWGRDINLDVSQHINALKPGNQMRSPRGCGQIWEGQSPGPPEGAVGKMRVNEWRSLGRSRGWSGRKAGRGWGVQGAREGSQEEGAVHSARHESPDHGIQCSWSELKQALSGPWQLQDSGRERRNTGGG